VKSSASAQRLPCSPARARRFVAIGLAPVLAVLIAFQSRRAATTPSAPAREMLFTCSARVKYNRRTSSIRSCSGRRRASGWVYAALKSLGSACGLAAAATPARSCGFSWGCGWETARPKSSVARGETSSSRSAPPRAHPRAHAARRRPDRVARAPCDRRNARRWPYSCPPVATMNV